MGEREREQTDFSSDEPSVRGACGDFSMCDFCSVFRYFWVAWICFVLDWLAEFESG